MTQGDRPLTWRSLDDLRRQRVHLAVLGGERAPANEFPPGVASGAPSRRDFLQMVGATAALTAMAGCVVKEAPSRLLPYGDQPPEVTPGNPLHFATSLPSRGGARGVLVASYEGRPTKIEGNPDCPESAGSTGILEQAAIYELYDPARARTITWKGAPRPRTELLRAVGRIVAAQREKRGAGLHFLLEPSGSPLLAGLRGEIAAALPEARFASWAPFSDEHRLAGAALAFGRPLAAQHDLTGADVVLCLDDDPLSTIEPGALRASREFAARRDPTAGNGATMNRLYAAEPAPTITGLCADHRVRVRASEIAGLARAILAALGTGSAAAPTGTERFVRAVAKDLASHQGRSLIIAGPRQPPAVHALVYALNERLGNLGRTLWFVAPPAPSPSLDSLRALCDAIDGGAVDALVITAFDPVYAAPPELELGRRLATIRDLIYLAPRLDATARAAGWVVPAAHPLESWGDERGHDGTRLLRQPLIDPLFGGLTDGELLSAFTSHPDASAYELLRASWQRDHVEPLAMEASWARAVRSGLVAESAAARETPTVKRDAIATAIAAPSPAPAPLEISVVADGKLLDGRHASNAWLQELPDPVTKLTWDNAALVSPATAIELGVELGDLVDLTVRGRSARLPILVLPGHVDRAITVAAGYGRRAAGLDPVGVDVYPLRSLASPSWDQVTIARVGTRYPLALTQDHSSMEGRKLALELPLDELRAGGEWLESERKPLPSMYAPVAYEGHKWGMAIDLGRCTGCSACVLACTTENNTPVVGKDQVARGREMQWLRIDRYFTGSPDDPGAITQPVACVHCENAPCEYVCPVNATVHSDEGLNEMVYNRCVGTRYCSNNCPYKVRRFNWFDFTGKAGAVEQMGRNPDVTVRARGVMEKCTYCVQRIERARITRRVDGKEIVEGDVVTACQQACPTGAIVFGDLSDGKSRVSRGHSDSRHYWLLHELNTRPRTAYLARVKNPNPELG